MSDQTVVGILGFGEVGFTLGGELSANGYPVLAWDIQFSTANSAPSRRLAGQTGVVPVASARGLSTQSDVLISAVTAASAIEALKSCEFDGQRECFYLDLNSVSPNTKCDLASIATQRGARFVEAAVMSPIKPKGMASPILLGGPSADAFLPIGIELGFSSLRVSSNEVGRAAATKMCRSVLIKGMEALVTESMIAGAHYGVIDEVLDSLSSLLPRDDWPEFAHYMMSRSIEHGIRRSEEMMQAALTVQDAGLEPLMTGACVERQRRNADFEVGVEVTDLKSLLETLANQLRSRAFEETL